MTAHVDTMPDSQRKQDVLAALKNIVQNLTGIKPEGMNVHVSFFDVGVDSLMLIQATQAIQDQFAVKLSVVQLLEELNTLDTVATTTRPTVTPKPGASSASSPMPSARAISRASSSTRMSRSSPKTSSATRTPAFSTAN